MGHLIHPHNLKILRSKLEQLNRRAAKLGCPPAEITILGEEQVERSRVMPGGKVIKYQVPMIDVQVTGETPKLANWCLVAVIEYLGDERLIRCVPGEECPEEFRTRGLECDHCRTQRRRKEVFVLRHENGEHKQVGRSCLADFLGGTSPEMLLKQAEWGFSINEAVEQAEKGWGGGPDVIDVVEYLNAVAICIRRLGWLSRRAARLDETSTATDAWNLLKPNCRTAEDKREHARWIEKNNLYWQERDEKLAAEALAWAQSQPVTGVSDYLYNLGVACRCGYVTYRTTGIVASAIQAYLKHQELEVKRREFEKKTRGHVGTVKKREVFGPLTVVGMNWFDGRYGTTTLLIFEDRAGNLLKWFASKELDDIEKGDVLTIKATVKKHGAYHGIPETIVQRVIVENRHETQTHPQDEPNRPETILV